MDQHSLEREATEYFDQLDKEYPLALDAYHSIIASCNSLLTSKSFHDLSSLIAYIENGDGQYAFKYIASTHRFRRIFYLIQLEEKYRISTPFYTACSSSDELMDKYLLTLFALRRILFHFSEDAVAGALGWLQDNTISYVAIQIILQSELINPDQTFYSYLNIIYPGVFNERS